MKNYKSFLESAEAIRDYSRYPIYDTLASYDSFDSRSFGYSDGVLYIGMNKNEWHSDLNNCGNRNELTFPGRLWFDKKLISFYEYPPSEQLPKVLEDIKETIYDEQNIVINWTDEWLIEIYKPAFDDGEYWDDFEDNPDDYWDETELVPLTEFVGSEDVDMNNIPPHLMSPLEKTEYLKKHGYKPKYIKTPQGMTQAEYRDKTTKYKYTESFRIFESNSNIMYHVTKNENVENILKNGLLINQPYAMTEGGYWATEIYGVNPIFLSIKSTETNTQKLLFDEFDTVLEVNVDGLELVADLPSLIDQGSQWENDVLYWSEGDEPEEIIDYLEEGEIEIEALVDPYFYGIDDFIELTGSAAVLQNIEPSRISIVNVA